MSKSKLSQIMQFLWIAAAVSALSVGGLLWYLTRDPVMGGDFSLQHRSLVWKFTQNTRDLSLLYFGYVKCPDVCPLSLSHTAAAVRALTDAERKKVQGIFVSVDAAHDLPSAVADYAEAFFPDFVGLTGTVSELQATAKLFGASFMVEKNSKSYLGYSIAHTDRLYFLDRRGVVIDSIANPRSAAEIAAKIRGHL